MKKTALFASLAILAIACAKTPEIIPELKCDEKEVVIPVQGTDEIDVFVEFTTNVDWTATIKENNDWCTISPKKGDAGDVKIKVQADPNPLKEPRKLTLVITAATLTESVTLIQSQVDAFELIETGAEFGPEGGEATIKVNTNVEWTVEIPSDCNWVHPVEAKAYGEQTKSFKVDAFDVFDASRETTISVKGADKTLKYTVTQKGPDSVFELMEAGAEFGPEGGDATIKVNTNIEWTVEIPSDCNWVHLAGTKAASEQTKTLTVDPYDVDNGSREVQISVKGAEKEPLIYTISQKGPIATIFELVSDEAYLDEKGGTVTITATTNVEWEIVIPEEYTWVRLDGTKATEEQSKTLTVDPYTELDGYREAEIVVKAGALEPIIFTIGQDGPASNIWNLNPTDYAEYAAGTKVRLAKYGENLLLLNGNKVLVIDPKTGNYLSTITIPGGMEMHSLCVDDANHVLISADAAYDTEMIVYRVDDVNNPVPTEFIKYNTGNYYGVDTGNIRVKGDIDKDAVITACVSDGAGGAMLAWNVKGGVLSTWYYSNVPYAGSTVTSCCAAPAGTDFADGFFYIGYGGDYNLKYLANFITDSTENTWADTYVTGSSWMENYNCIATAEWNGKKYAAIVKGCHFNYDATDVVLLDVTSPASAQEVFAVDCDGMVSRSESWDNLDWTGVGAYSDVLLVPSEEALYIFYVDANFNVIGCARYI
ncbi:MAG: BACON domain-containing protein [Candidatus Cryptobacteroides sp.]